jgi:beta-galactosidase
MRDVLTGAAVLGSVCTGLLLSGHWQTLRAVAVRPAKEKATTPYIDLQPKANHKLTDNFHTPDSVGNNLAELPKGVQKFAGVKFLIGNSLIQLASPKVPNKPAKVEGIAVSKFFTKLHILHATGYTVTDGILIGKYVIHYEDRTTAAIRIVYGKDVLDWWNIHPTKVATRGKVAWEGKNQNTASIRLFLTTWQNPHPRKKVVSIDYLSTQTSDAAPFCVAMTVQTR